MATEITENTEEERRLCGLCALCGYRTPEIRGLSRGSVRQDDRARAPQAIDRGRHDPAGEPGALADRVKPLGGRRFAGDVVPLDADGRGAPALGADEEPRRPREAADLRVEVADRVRDRL